MSTRMSDWSANPLISRFFAVELDPTDDMRPLVYQYPIKRDIVDKENKISP
jgi:hypothetical protein